MKHNKFQLAVDEVLKFVDHRKSLYEDADDIWHNIDEYIIYEDVRITILEALGDHNYEPPK